MFEFEPSDDRGLSPVIGVILLVGITVILVAVVGGLVTDFGSDIEVAPNAQFNADFNTDGNNITITHGSGDDINPDNVEFEYTVNNGTERGPTDFNEAVDSNDTIEGLFQSGDEVTLSTGSLLKSDDVSSGGEIRMIWTGENGNQREVLIEEIVP